MIAGSANFVALRLPRAERTADSQIFWRFACFSRFSGIFEQIFTVLTYFRTVFHRLYVFSNLLPWIPPVRTASSGSVFTFFTSRFRKLPAGTCGARRRQTAELAAHPRGAEPQDQSSPFACDGRLHYFQI